MKRRDFICLFGGAAGRVAARGARAAAGDAGGRVRPQRRGQPRPVGGWLLYGGVGALPSRNSNRKQCGCGAGAAGADRAFPAREPWLWPCIGPR
jgi:hypothetical protein